MSGGRALELAISRGSREYRRRGRKCVMVRQFTPFTIVNGRRRYLSVGAPCDFIGAVDGKPYAAEAKETAQSRFDLDARRVKQWGALSLLKENGYSMQLIVDFTEIGECYLVGWWHVEKFLAAPWRKSLPLQWFHAYGFLLPEVDRGHAGRATLFLDGTVSPLARAGVEAVEAEQRTSALVTFDEPGDDEPDEKPQARVQLTKEQRLAGVRDAIENGKWRKAGR